MPTDREAHAWERLQEAYQAQMEGDYDRAIELYRRSLALHPTAEAHTFLGWTFHFQGKIDEAIAAKRYDPRHFPYFNLGRAYLAKGLINRAREQFQQALAIEPRYTLARRALENLRRLVN